MTAPGEGVEGRKYPSATKAGNVLVPAELAAAWAELLDETASLVLEWVRWDRSEGVLSGSTADEWELRLEQLADAAMWLGDYAMYAQLHAVEVRDRPAVGRWRVNPTA